MSPRPFTGQVQLASLPLLILSLAVCSCNPDADRTHIAKAVAVGTQMLAVGDRDVLFVAKDMNSADGAERVVPTGEVQALIRDRHISGNDIATVGGVAYLAASGAVVAIDFEAPTPTVVEAVRIDGYVYALTYSEPWLLAVVGQTPDLSARVLSYTLAESGALVPAGSRDIIGRSRGSAPAAIASAEGVVFLAGSDGKVWRFPADPVNLGAATQVLDIGERIVSMAIVDGRLFLGPESGGVLVTPADMPDVGNARKLVMAALIVDIQRFGNYAALLPLRGRVGLWPLDAPEGHESVEVLEVEDVVGVVDGVDPKGFVVSRRRSELRFVEWTD